MTYFRSDDDIIVFLLGGMKMSGSAGLFNNFFFFTSSGAQRWAEREMGNTQNNTATLKAICPCMKGQNKRALGLIAPPFIKINH